MERAAKAAGLSVDQLTSYRQRGHLLLRGFLDAQWLSRLRPEIVNAFERHRPDTSAITRPRTAYERAFTQVVNMGLTEPAVRELTWSAKLGAAAAALMGTQGARIFIEDAMFKEAGGGRTPWHQDGSSLPFEPKHMVTAWIPLVPVDAATGLLRFVTGSHELGLLGPVDISESTDAMFEAIIRERQLPIEDSAPMQPGDVSFHAGTTIHCAFPNTSQHTRELLAIHYFADGVCIGALDNPTRERLARHCAPQLVPGDSAVADAWPRVYPAEEDAHAD
ncbi:MAG: phytanoyl-CoA dioxygenase family protein [Polyangiaceae bacterium]